MTWVLSGRARVVGQGSRERNSPRQPRPVEVAGLALPQSLLYPWPNRMLLCDSFVPPSAYPDLGEGAWMSGADENVRLELLEEGRQILARITSGRTDVHLDEISDWSNRVLDWAALTGERVPLPGVALRLVDFHMDERAQAYVEEVVAILSGSSGGAMTAAGSGRAFISYVREDATAVSRLADELTAYGARVWLDRNDLQPGQNWKDSIRRAIISGSFFIWCNSDASVSKSRSYANEELNLAIEELRMRSTDQAWFVPVKLTDAALPDREIGGGRRLSDLQWVDLSADWYVGVRRIAQLVAPLPTKERTLIRHLESPDIRERTSAAERLYDAPDPRLVVPLCELIRRAGRSDIMAVYWAGRALERIRDVRAVPVLIEALLRGVGHEYKLVENLETFDTEESNRFLAEYHSTDSRPFERIRWLRREAERRGLERRR